MKLIYAAINVAEVGLLQGLLQENGIRCTIRNQFVASISLANAFLPELWIENDADWNRARGILDGWQSKDTENFENWKCPNCGQENEGQFGACWNCDYEIDET